MLRKEVLAGHLGPYLDRIWTLSGPCLDPVWRDRRPASGSVRLSSHRAQTRSIWGKWFRLGEMMPGWRLSGATQAA